MRGAPPLVAAMVCALVGTLSPQLHSTAAAVAKDEAWTSRPLRAVERAALTPAVWRRGCPVPLSDIRRLTVEHRNDVGEIVIGQLDVHRAVAIDVLEIFRDLLRSGVTLHSVIPIEAFGGDDDRSVDADNTSAFNCRRVLGTNSYSRHSYGLAIDINPLRNPYIVRGTVQPRAGAHRYLDRSAVASEPGVITADGPIVAAFARRGWRWGGTWNEPVDYQHFDRRLP